MSSDDGDGMVDADGVGAAGLLVGGGRRGWGRRGERREKVRVGVRLGVW